MWITLHKEIKESTGELRKRLYKIRETIGPFPLTEKEKDYWHQITTILKDEIKQINNKIGIIKKKQKHFHSIIYSNGT